MQHVLAISGKRFYGKDTFAAMLQQHARARGLELQAYAFATESKRMFVDQQRARGVELELERLLGDRAYKERWRPELTALTVAALAADPLVFCREVARRIEAAARPALITDLRLRLELAHLSPRFALRVVRLERGDAARARCGWAWTAGVDDHPTETELDDPALWDEVVPNDGTLAELSTHAARIVTDWPGAGAPRSDR